MLRVSISGLVLMLDFQTFRVSSTEIACGVDKPLKNHLETTMKQQVGSKVQICKGLSSFG
jgi:hypothetical protein